MATVDPLDEPDELTQTSRWIPNFEVGAAGVGPPITPYSGEFYPIGAADAPDDADSLRRNPSNRTASRSRGAAQRRG